MDDELRFVEDLRAGSPGAFEKLVQEYGSRLLQRARLLTWNRTEAEELVYDTFAESFTAIKRFRGQSSLLRWLCGIQINLFRYRAREMYKRHSQTQPMQIVDESTTPKTEEPLHGRFRELLPSLLEQLSEKHREVILLRYMNDMELNEMAHHLDIPEGTVKSRLFNAMEEIRKLLKKMNLSTDGATYL